MAAVRVVLEHQLPFYVSWAISSRPFFRKRTHLSVVNVANGANVHMRLGALESSGVVPRAVRELCLAPCAESCLDGVGAGLVAQSTRGAEGDPSERHSVQVLLTATPTHAKK